MRPEPHRTVGGSRLLAGDAACTSIAGVLNVLPILVNLGAAPRNTVHSVQSDAGIVKSAVKPKWELAERPVLCFALPVLAHRVDVLASARLS